MPLEPTNTSLYKGQALISLTYDDGFKSTYDLALPLHLEFNIQAGFAIIAGRAMAPQFWSRYMTAQQVTEASRQGIEIYSHSYSHPRLMEVDDTTVEFEMQESQKVLNKLVTGRQNSVTALCVPFSQANKRIMDTAEKYYSCIRVKGDKCTPLRAPDQTTVYSYGINKDTSFDTVKGWIDKAVADKAWITLMLHGITQKAEEMDRKYDINPALLRQILQYISDIGRDKLLPANFSDVQAIRQGLAAPAP